MAAITPALIRELREVSGAGMTDCKKALDSADGDLQKAIVILREKGLATAAKKAGRIAAEGLVTAITSADGSVGAIAEVNCETDFVAKNPAFKEFVGNVASKILAEKPADIEALLNLKWDADDSGATVGDAVKAKIALYGENTSIRRFAVINKPKSGLLKTYVHGAESRVAVLLAVESDKVTAGIEEAAKNVCLQIAFSKPMYVSKDEVEQSFVDAEKAILTEQTKNDDKAKGKPDAVIAKMVEGRLAKRLKEVCLLDQEYVKDAEQTVASYFAKAAKDEGISAKIAAFAVYEKGEGIEKKSEDFAEEVNKMIGK